MYRINGHQLFSAADGVAQSLWTSPSSHSVAPMQPSLVKTLGGQIVVESPSGNLNVHSWIYDPRPTSAVAALLSYIGNGRLAVIDTYDNVGQQLTNVLCVVSIPEIKSAGKRNWAEAYTIQFTEIVAQS